MTVRIKILSLLLAGLLFAGCASVSPYRAHPSLEERGKVIKTVVVLPPRVEVFQLTAGGIKEKMDEWSAEAKKNVMTAIEGELTGRPGLLIKPLSEDSLPREVESDLEETQALFDAVNASIIFHTYGPPEQLFSDKIKGFDYSLGQEVEGLRILEADALLLVRGVDHISTEGRKALQTGAVLLGALVGVVVVPRGGVAAVSIALVDAHSGSILWYNFKGSAGGHDLRDPTSAASLVKGLLKDFPIQ